MLLYFRAIGLAFLLVGWGSGGPVPNRAAAQPESDSTARTARPALGHPVVRHIPPQAYDGNGHVWDIAQDGRGLLYIASSYGLQQYDGARWRSLPTANGTTPFAAARDPSGTLFIGAQDDLGTYRPDSLGRLTYRSLRAEVPNSHRPVGDVVQVAATGDGVFFRTERGVLRWTGRRMQAVTDTTTGGLFTCRDAAFVQDASGLLHRITGAEMQPVPGADRLREAAVMAIVRGSGGGCDAVTEGSARFSLTPSGARPIALPGGPMDGPVVDAVRGPGGALAVATEWTLRLVGPNGTRHDLTQETGRIPGEIKALTVSDRNALWVATSAGILRVAWPDPVSLVKNPPAVRSIPGAIARYEGDLMLSTEQGLWRATPDTIQHVAADGYVYDLVPTRSGLLASGSDGVFLVRDRSVRFLVEDVGAYALHRSRRDSSVAYATLFEGGLLRLQQADDGWRVAERAERLETLAPSIAQSPDGDLWLGTGHRGILRVEHPRRGLADAPVTRFDTTDGLPAPSFNYVTQLGDSVRFPTEEGLFRFTGSRFEPDPDFEPVYADGIRKSWFARQDESGGVWMDFGGHKLGVARGWREDSLRWFARPYRRVADVGDVWSIYPDAEQDSVVWFGAEGALIRYDRRLQPYGGSSSPFRTLIRGVEVDGDSVLYGGDRPASRLGAPIGPDRNRLRFQFGSTSFEQIDGPTHNWDRPRQYRWQLDGFEPTWTDWTTEAQADFTSLPPGEYTLRVQARNLYQTVGKEATLGFRVLPPWYRTGWAYGLYVLAALAVVAGAVRWRTRHLRRRQQALEEAVADRTEEVRTQRNRLEKQADRLKELDEAKSRFFANISHEFRTPLTLIRGPIAEVRKQIRRGRLEAPAMDEEEAADQLAVAGRNTERLQRLIDQILGLARLEAGTYDLAARPTALGPAVRRIADRFAPLADRQRLSLRVETDPPPAEAEPAYVDPDALEYIAGNLLSNAIKFTTAGGTVVVAVREESNAAVLVVRDDGPGIPEDQQETIFERFTRADGTNAGDRQGAGIGLEFTNDLVQLHGGTVELESAEGEGTTVTVRLPRGPEALAEEHISGEPISEGPKTEERDPEEQVTEESFSGDGAFSDGASGEGEFGDGDSGSRGSERRPNQDESSRLVLVVDDHADVRRYVRSVLEPEFQVREAADGEAGIRAARRAQPDVILADVMMPGVDGHGMTARLKDDPETAPIPVIMVTARAGTRDEVEGLKAGADDYVTKPFDADVLRQRVGGVLALQERLRRRLRTEMQADGPVSPSEESPLGPVEEAARGAIRENITDPDFGVDELAAAVSMSRSTLYRKLKAEADATPSALIRTVRMKTARSLLREGEPATQVAYAVGYASLSSFSRAFAKDAGMTPSEFANAPDAGSASSG
jgi:signal transduction histidine kinase/CheY-like chemotaxis protein